MLAGLKKKWRHFAALSPGKRFEAEYHAHRKARRSAWSRLGSVGLGVVITAIGIVALPMPGPGILIVAFGAALLARESLALAKLLDRSEVWLRRAAGWGRRAWRRASLAMKVLVGSLGAGAAAAVAVLLYRLTFAR